MNKDIFTSRNKKIVVGVSLVLFSLLLIFRVASNSLFSSIVIIDIATIVISLIISYRLLKDRNFRNEQNWLDSTSYVLFGIFWGIFAIENAVQALNINEINFVIIYKLITLIALVYISINCFIASKNRTGLKTIDT